METSEKWCALKDDCDLPISNGLLDETASGLNPTSDPMSKFPFHLRSVDMLGSSELNLTNSTCVYPFCVAVLSYTIKNTNVRVYDLLLFLLSFVFLAYLLVLLFPMVKKLRGSLPLFRLLYCMVFVIPVVSLIYEVVSMTLGYFSDAAKVLHVFMRGAILLTELSVVIFGLFFKYYISRWKVVATMTVIFSISIIFTVAEGVLEFLDLHRLPCSDFKFFTHGGMVFLFSTSVAFSVAYLLTFLIYILGCHRRLNLPSKKSFYRYALFLCVVNIIQAVGSFLWYYGNRNPRAGNAGICLTVIVNMIYVGTFAPMVYWIFLSNYFRMNKDLKEAANKENRINVVSKDQAESSVFSRTSSSNPLQIGRKGRGRYSDQTSLLPESFGSVSSYGSVDDEEVFNRLTPEFVK